MKSSATSHRISFLDLFNTIIKDGLYRIDTPKTSPCLRTTIFLDGDILSEIDGSSHMAGIDTDCLAEHNGKLIAFQGAISRFRNYVKNTTIVISYIISFGLTFFYRDQGHYFFIGSTVVAFLLHRFRGPAFKYIIRYGGKFILKIALYFLNRKTKKVPVTSPAV